MNYDIVICTLPNSELRGPLMGPPALKSYLESKGFFVKCIDLNIDLWHKLDKDKDYFVTNEYNYFIDDQLFETLYIEKRLDLIIHNWAHDLINMSVEWIGISVHWKWNEKIAKLLCKEIKRINPQQKIVLGGSYTEFLYEELNAFIDAYIIGEGEEALESLLNDTLILNDNRATVENFQQMPRADYSDYDFSQYPREAFHNDNKKMGLRFLYIQGSRSCVRKCTFCTIPQLFSSFRFKSGQIIAQEMKELYHEHGIKEFIFADNLINGNLKQFNELLDAIIEVQGKNNIKFNWHSHYIVRSPKQITKETFQKLSEAGCSRLKIGVESGSEDVRRDMRKPFPTEYVVNTVEQCHKHNIQARVLLFVGYPTETTEKFQDTLTLLHTLSPYKDSIMLAVGHMATVMEPSSLSMELYDIQKDNRFENQTKERFWIYQDNDIYERLRRHKEMVKLAIELGFDIDDPLEMWTKEKLDQLRSF